MTNPQFWNPCLQKLREILSEEDVDTWLAPLHVFYDRKTLKLLAPNRYVLNHVKLNLFPEVKKVVLDMDSGINDIRLEIGSYGLESPFDSNRGAGQNQTSISKSLDSDTPYSSGALNSDFVFSTHIEGKSNQLARAAALQVAQSPGTAYNPLFIYGGVGLGKTHLMQAAGNLILERNPRAKVIYVHSELFVNDMVKALTNNTMANFKDYYRSLDALLIDDIQFFAKKPQSQEQFFHTFNTLMGGQRQIIITSDRIPNAINHIEDRLISRFVSGLTMAIEPPELETRVAILEKKALLKGISLPSDVAFFVASNVHSNVRDLEGALHRIIASANFTGHRIDMPLARNALADILIYRKNKINIENIQQVVAAHYKIRVSDMISKKRHQTVARPRQLAMVLTRELTDMSLPEIGDRFGGRDHTTVLHACRKVKDLRETDNKVREDYQNLLRLLGL